MNDRPASQACFCLSMQSDPDASASRQGSVYAAIDLKSFYASVECVERGLDALHAHLVVADASRTEKTICLAVSPALKAYGIPGRPRLFEVVARVEEINRMRRADHGKPLRGCAKDAQLLAAHPEMALDYWVTPPRMSLYIEYSTRIYEVYLKYVAPEHIHVYSIDEVFIELTPYLSVYKTTPRELTSRMIRDVLQTTGVTATGGIGSNLYLAKVAMDILSKHSEPDADGVRIAELDEMSYRHRLWCHRPLIDFWRVGHGYARKLHEHGMYTMGDIARRSLSMEDSLYALFGVNAELLIDHAWGWEPCTMEQIKAYRPTANSLSSGQVLHCPYTADLARLVLREMADQLALELVEKGLVAEQVSLSVGYDIENMTRPDIKYDGPVKIDHYGRSVPKSAHGSARLPQLTASGRQITEALLSIYDREVKPQLLVRRLTVGAQNVLPEDQAHSQPRQMELFTDHAAEQEELRKLEREHKMQQTMLDIKRKFGKNAILKGLNLQKGATATQRNSRIGGHSA